MGLQIFFVKRTLAYVEVHMIARQILSGTIFTRDVMPNCGTSDLEKAASGASGACGHFVENHAILRTLRVKSRAFSTQDGGRRVEDGKLRMDQ